MKSENKHDAKDKMDSRLPATPKRFAEASRGNDAQSDAMESAQERNLDMLLEERLAGRTPPDLSARVLNAAKAGGVDTAPIHDLSVVREKRANPWAIAAAAASVVLGLGLIVADRWISEKPQDMPLAMQDDASEEDILFIEDSAEPIDVGDGYIEGVAGRALVSTRGLPAPEKLAAMTEMFRARHNMNPKEITMMKDRRNWIARGGLAMCVLSGGVLFNNDEAYFAEEDSAAKTTESSANESGWTASVMGPSDDLSEAIARSNFEDLDGNKDGYLDTTEYPLAIDPADDTDGDGRYSQAEYLTQLVKAVQKEEAAIAAALKQFQDTMAKAQADGLTGTAIDSKEYDPTYFDELDVNHDGDLDGNEYRISRLLNRDRNTDGVVSRAEWDATKMPPNPFAALAQTAQDADRVADLQGKIQKMRVGKDGEVQPMKPKTEIRPAPGKPRALMPGSRGEKPGK